MLSFGYWSRSFVQGWCCLWFQVVANLFDQNNELACVAVTDEQPSSILEMYASRPRPEKSCRVTLLVPRPSTSKQAPTSQITLITPGSFSPRETHHERSLLRPVGDMLFVPIPKAIHITPKMHRPDHPQHRAPPSTHREGVARSCHKRSAFFPGFRDCFLSSLLLFDVCAYAVDVCLLKKQIAQGNVFECCTGCCEERGREPRALLSHSFSLRRSVLSRPG